MKLSDFLRLSQPEQLSVVFMDGVFLGHRQTALQKILLCQVHGFYVEIVHNRKERKTEEVRAFDEVDRLEPYLERIDISGLLAGSV